MTVISVKKLLGVSWQNPLVNLGLRLLNPLHCLVKAIKSLQYFCPLFRQGRVKWHKQPFLGGRTGEKAPRPRRFPRIP
jgi:hypothetical protein